MNCNAIIWGIGSTFSTYRNAIYHEVECGRLTIIGYTGSNSIYKSIDGYPFIEKDELIGLDFDIIIVAAQDKVLPDIYHEAEALQIERSKFVRASVFSIPDFDMEKYMQLRKNRVSIISWNCFGGVLYHFLDLPFSSPTINLFFDLPEFLTMCNDLPHYMALEPVLENFAWEQNLKMKYPVMKLGETVRKLAP